MARNSQALGWMGVQAAARAHGSPPCQNLQNGLPRAMGGGSTLRRAMEPGAADRDVAGPSGCPAFPLDTSAGSAPTAGEEGPPWGGKPQPWALGHLAGEVFFRAGFFISVLESSFIFRTTSCISICSGGVDWEFPWQSGGFQIAQCFRPSAHEA